LPEAVISSGAELSGPMILLMGGVALALLSHGSAQISKGAW